jgi:hypothetical protein
LDVSERKSHCLIDMVACRGAGRQLAQTNLQAADEDHMQRRVIQKQLVNPAEWTSIIMSGA